MVPGHAPLREGGGAAMNGISMHGKRQVAGAATGGVLRAAVATTSTSLQQQADQTFCESIMCKHASTAHRSTPPTALSIHSQGTILAPSGGPPLSEGGGCLRMSHSAHAAPRSHHHHPLPLKSLQNLFSILIWPYLFLNRSSVRGRRSYFSCRFVGLWMQPLPVLVEPHQMHREPGPWRCLPVGLWMQPLPYELDPHHSQCFSSSRCSCFFVGLWMHPLP